MREEPTAMPLPSNPDQKWPPASPERYDLAEWAAWYSGDPARLAGLPDPFTGLTHNVDSQIALSNSERFWARQARRTVESSDPLGVHVPLAAELAQLSADLVLGKMPHLVIPVADDGNDDGSRNNLSKTAAKAAQARLEDIIVDGDVANTLRDAAESASALSGAYVKVVWDKSIADYPFLAKVDADYAHAEWRLGKLYAVTFWRDLGSSGTTTWRHLERHEPGVILNGLYAGTITTLGTRMSMDAHPETAGIPEEIVLPTGYPYPLTVEFFPNAPNTKYRGMGDCRSDFAGSEGLLERVDLTVSSWMRDVEIGRGRVAAPSGALEPVDTGILAGPFGRGNGMKMNWDRSVYDPINLDPSGEGQGLTIIQFKIRTEEHLATAQYLTERIASRAGWAPQTVGLHLEGNASTGTALRIRENRTFSTIVRKRSRLTQPIRRLCAGLLAIDQIVFGRPTPIAVPVLTWDDPRDNDPTDLAQTLSLFSTAKAMSQRTLIRMAQPDLDEDQVEAEYQQMLAEEQDRMGSLGPVPDPLAYSDHTDPHADPNAA